MKVGTIYNISEGLAELSEKELPISIALIIKRNQSKIAAELKSTDELRDKIINKYKEFQRGDGSIQLKKDKIPAFNKEYEELMNEEIEIDLQTIDINTIEGISIKPRTLTLIDPILTETKQAE